MQDAVDVFQHIVVPKPEDLVAFAYEKICPSLVARAAGVLTAVDFDNQHSLPAQEITDEWANWHLA